MVERQLPKLNVTGSSPVTRSPHRRFEVLARRGLFYFGYIAYRRGQ